MQVQTKNQKLYKTRIKNNKNYNINQEVLNKKLNKIGSIKPQ